MKALNRFSPILLVLGVTFGCTTEPELAPTPPVEVIVSQPIKGKIEQWDTYTGLVDSEESVEIRARVRGEIKEVRIKGGEEVKENDVLFVIDSDLYKAEKMQAQGTLESWDAKLKVAEEKIAIYKPLVEKGSAAKQDLDQAIANKGEATGGVLTTKGKLKEVDLNIGYCTIKSPIAGRVGRAMLTKGNLVHSGGESLMTTVVSVDPMHVYFDVNERAVQDYQKILEKAGKKINQGDKPAELSPGDFPVKVALVTDEEYGIKGYIDFVDNRVDPATGSKKLRAVVANPLQKDGRRRLAPGLFARVQISLMPSSDAVLVADRAILTDQSLKYVLIVDKADKNTVRRVDVVVSQRVQPSGLRGIEAGLKGDEWVIVEGVNRARPGAPVEPKTGDMPQRPIAKK